MKFTIQILLSFAFVFCAFALNAQNAPAGINYQAVLRDQQGQIIADQAIKAKISVNDPESRSTFYTETHTVTTNNVGIFTLIIGGGKAEKGAFKDIPWSSANTWLEVAYDTDNNGIYEISGATRMLSVPYAFYAEKAGVMANNNANTTGADGGGGFGEEAWMLKGNQEVDDSWMFMGTRNFADLVIKTHDKERIRITKGVGSDAHDALINLQEDVTADKSVSIGGTLSVGGHTLLKDELMVVGKATLKNDLEVGGNTYMIGFASVGGNLNVTGFGVFNQDITVLGGGSFGTDVKIDHDLFVHNDIWVDRNFDLGNDLHVGNDADIDHDLNVDNNAHIDNSLTVRNSAEIGLDLAVGRNAVIGNDFYVVNNAYVQNNLSVTKDATVGQDLVVIRNASIGQDLEVARNLDVDDAAHIGANLDVDNNANVDKDLSVGGNFTLGGGLKVAGLAEFNEVLIENNLKVKGDAELQQDVRVGQNLDVDGAAVFGNYVEVAGSASVNGDLNANCRLNVHSCVTGPDYDIFSYPVLVHGGNQGIAIKVEEARSGGNNFVSFFDAEGMQGRIEGQTKDELHNSFEYVWYQVMEASGVGLTAAEAVACGVQLDFLEVAVNTIDAVLSLADWIQYDVNMDLKVGVVYESGSGDYAEYLERDNPADVMHYGEIVGVIGGKISRNTPANSKVMVISYSPIVLGNMPAPNREKDFEKVAFMGQVPVRVAGKVEIGDYILPSGHNDGIGIAVNPSNMRTEDYARIVGIAWEASKGDLINLVNVAVGINTNDIALRVAQQELELNKVKHEINQIYALLGEKSPYNGLLPGTPVNAVVAQNNTVPANMDAMQQGMTKAAANQKIEAARPMLEDMMNKTRTRFEAEGINYQQYPEVVSILNNPVAYLQSMNDRGYLSEGFLNGGGRE